MRRNRSGPSRPESVGDIDGPVAAVHHDGSVTPVGAGWLICWAVGAEDRWHIAAEEAAVRSRLVDEMPVTETAMRVPGGDVRQRAAAVRDAAGRAVVLEFINDTPVPVSLALAVVPGCVELQSGVGVARPRAGCGSERGVNAGRVARAEVRGSRMVADGRVAVDLGRTPGGTVSAEAGDVWRAVRAGPAAGDCEARSRSGLATAAAVMPLVPRAPLRVVVPIEGSAVRPRDTEGAAGGWRAVVARAAEAQLPLESQERAWRKGTAAAILAAGGRSAARAARAAILLDRLGMPDEADRGREVVLGEAEKAELPSGDAVAALRALASRRLRCGRTSALAEWAGLLAESARDRLDTITLEQVATALEAEASGAARDARRLLARIRGRESSDPASVADGDLRAALRSSTAFGGDGLVGIEQIMGRLLEETPDGLVLLADCPPSWIGAPIDVRSMVTRHGPLSFSLRWHGARPALLWERGPVPGIVVRCGLDGAWSSTDTAGEALLAHGP